MFVFDFETYKDQEFAEAYAAGLFDVNRLRDRWDTDLTCDEIEIERKLVISFDKSCRNPLVKTLKFNLENYEGNSRTYIDKDWDETVSSYRRLLVAHN